MTTAVAAGVCPPSAIAVVLKNKPLSVVVKPNALGSQISSRKPTASTNAAAGNINNIATDSWAVDPSGPITSNRAMAGYNDSRDLWAIDPSGPTESYIAAVRNNNNKQQALDLSGHTVNKIATAGHNNNRDLWAVDPSRLTVSNMALEGRHNNNDLTEGYHPSVPPVSNLTTAVLAINNVNPKDHALPIRPAVIYNSIAAPQSTTLSINSEPASSQAQRCASSDDDGLTFMRDSL